MTRFKKYILLTLPLAAVIFTALPAEAHRSGCHRWHSCPSDTGSYTCGDAGHPCQYPTYPKSGGVVYPPNGYYKDCYDCPTKKVPTNSHTSGISWACDSGYYKVGTGCRKILAPANSYAVGSSWYCNSGYRKVGNACQKVAVPSNGYVIGTSIYCNDGYFKSGDSCLQVIAPVNAHVSGSTWYCDTGYTLNEDRTGCYSTASYNATCSAAYANSEWNGTMRENKLICDCQAGYAWNAALTACESKTQELSIIPPVPAQTCPANARLYVGNRCICDGGYIMENGACKHYLSQ